MVLLKLLFSALLSYATLRLKKVPYLLEKQSLAIICIPVIIFIIGLLFLSYVRYLLDESLRQVPVGKPGEICIGGQGVALGYYNNPATTAVSFVPDPLDPTKTIYRTGDFGRMRPDGNVDFIARKDSQVKISGYRVEIGEVQHAISSHPSILFLLVFFVF